MKHKFRFITGLFIFLFLSSFTLSAQKTTVKRIDPPSWWTGMHNPKLQLLVYGPNISQTKPEISYAGVTLQKVIHVESPNYLFLNLILSEDTKPGTFNILFKKGKRNIAKYAYTLNARNMNPKLH